MLLERKGSIMLAQIHLQTPLRSYRGSDRSTDTLFRLGTIHRLGLAKKRKPQKVEVRRQQCMMVLVMAKVQEPPALL